MFLAEFRETVDHKIAEKDHRTFKYRKMQVFGNSTLKTLFQLMEI